MPAKKTPKLAKDWNERLKQGDYKRYGTAKPKMKNPFDKVGKAIGNALVPADKKAKKPTKYALIEEYSKSRIASKKGKKAAKRVLGK